jgi:hypothetical protein
MIMLPGIFIQKHAGGTGAGGAMTPGFDLLPGSDDKE